MLEYMFCPSCIPSCCLKVSWLLSFMKISIFGFSNFTKNCMSAQCLTKNVGVCVLSFLHSKLLFKSIVVTQFHQNKYFLGFRILQKILSLPNVLQKMLEYMFCPSCIPSCCLKVSWLLSFIKISVFWVFEFYKKL